MEALQQVINGPLFMLAMLVSIINFAAHILLKWHQNFHRQYALFGISLLALGWVMFFYGATTFDFESDIRELTFPLKLSVGAFFASVGFAIGQLLKIGQSPKH